MEKLTVFGLLILGLLIFGCLGSSDDELYQYVSADLNKTKDTPSDVLPPSDSDDLPLLTKECGQDLKCFSEAMESCIPAKLEYDGLRKLGAYELIDEGDAGCKLVYTLLDDSGHLISEGSCYIDLDACTEHCPRPDNYCKN